MSADLRVLADPAAAATERLAAAAGAGGHVALAGGSTPRAAYERAAATEVEWGRCTLWFGDERCVPPDDERSNHRIVREALLDRIAVQPRVRRIRGELPPSDAARAYEAELREDFGAEGPPRLDLVLLGLGPDAHCASLFPGDPALAERERLAVAVERPPLEPRVPRVTLTLPVLNGAREVVFLVTGADKAEAVERAFGGAPDPDAPASLVSGPVVLLDAEAAERIPAAAGGEAR